MGRASVSEVVVTTGITLPAEALVPGENVLAVEVHDAADGESDLCLAATLTVVVSPEPEADALGPLAGLLLSDLAPSWVELLNDGAAPVDVSGVVLAVSGTSPSR